MDPNQTGDENQGGTTGGQAPEETPKCHCGRDLMNGNCVECNMTEAECTCDPVAAETEGAGEAGEDQGENTGGTTPPTA